MSASIPRGTEVVSVQVTDACDLACGYCPSDLHGGSRGMTRAAFERMLDECEAAGCRRIAIGGGEPTLWPELGWALGLARERGFETAVTTNGRDPVGARQSGAGTVCVSLPKGRWREMGMHPGAVANVVHLGARLAETFRLVVRAADAGFRRVALLAYKGSDVALRATDQELALLVWLAGKLNRTGIEAACDSYTYRRIGLAQGCGQGFARISVNGSVGPCSFSACEFYPDRAAQFAAEQHAGIASVPVRESVLIENSEMGYVVPLSDSLEVSLSQLPWEAVEAAVVEFKRIAEDMGPLAKRIAAAIQPHMNDGGFAPAPMIGFYDEALGYGAGRLYEGETQRVLDRATSFPLAGRRVVGSSLLREPGENGVAITRDDYIDDLRFAIMSPTELWTNRSHPAVPSKIASRRLDLISDLVRAVVAIDMTVPVFGQGFVEYLIESLRPTLEVIAREDLRKARAEVEAIEWSPTLEEGLRWLQLAATLGEDVSGHLKAHMAHHATLVERISDMLAIAEYAPNVPWVQDALAELLAETRTRYTSEGQTAVALAVEQVRHMSTLRVDPPRSWYVSETQRVDRALPDAVVEARRTGLVGRLEYSLHLGWGEPPGPDEATSITALTAAVENSIQQYASSAEFELAERAKGQRRPCS